MHHPHSNPKSHPSQELASVVTETQPQINVGPNLQNECDFTHLLTYLLHVLLEKLTGLQLIKKFPAFYGAQRFVTALLTIKTVTTDTFNIVFNTETCDLMMPLYFLEET